MRAPDNCKALGTIRSRSNLIESSFSLFAVVSASLVCGSGPLDDSIQLEIALKE